jgi:trehalose/maltose transport system substrate-binding protein
MGSRTFHARVTAALGAAGLAAAGWAADPGAAQAQSLSISCGALGVELELCREGAEAWSAQSGVPVEIVSTPNSSTERLALYQQLLAAGASDIDLFQVDVVWPGILADHFVDLSQYVPDAGDGHFEALIANNTVDGRLVALPWWTDAGVLYYRTDLLEKHGHEAPATWQEMTKIAADIQQAERASGDDDLWGFVFQGKAYEGLTCNALEWIDSFGGGEIVAEDGAITVNNPDAEAALELAGSWVGAIAPKGVLNYAEEEARGVFQSGNAVFMRNWPYAWALANGEESAIKGKVGVVALPKGGPDGQHTGTLGGWNVAVSKYSEHPELAAELAAFLTGRAEQKRRALEASYNPTYPALYEDEEVLAANPFFGQLYETFSNAVARPSGVTGDEYNRVSAEFWSAVHNVLSGQQPADEALAELERGLMRISRRGRW